MDVPVCKDGTSIYIVIVQAKLNKAFTIVINHATTMLSAMLIIIRVTVKAGSSMPELTAQSQGQGPILRALCTHLFTMT